MGFKSKNQESSKSKSGLKLDSEAFSSDDFRIYQFKVKRCPRARPHDWTQCPFAHPGEKAARRDPKRFCYSGIACPDYRRSGECEKKNSCPYAHGVFECWLHPSRYKTQMCTDGGECKRVICFFAHAQDEVRYVNDSSILSDASLMLMNETFQRQIQAMTGAAGLFGNPSSFLQAEEMLDLDLQNQIDFSSAMAMACFHNPNTANAVTTFHSPTRSSSATVPTSITPPFSVSTSSNDHRTSSSADFTQSASQGGSSYSLPLDESIKALNLGSQNPKFYSSDDNNHNMAGGGMTHSITDPGHASTTSGLPFPPESEMTVSQRERNFAAALEYGDIKGMNNGESIGRQSTDILINELLAGSPASTSQVPPSLIKELLVKALSSSLSSSPSSNMIPPPSSPSPSSVALSNLPNPQQLYLIQQYLSQQTQLQQQQQQQEQQQQQVSSSAMLKLPGIGGNNSSNNGINNANYSKIHSNTGTASEHQEFYPISTSSLEGSSPSSFDTRRSPTLNPTEQSLNGKPPHLHQQVQLQFQWQMYQQQQIRQQKQQLQQQLQQQQQTSIPLQIANLFSPSMSISPELKIPNALTNSNPHTIINHLRRGVLTAPGSLPVGVLTNNSHHGRDQATVGGLESAGSEPLNDFATRDMLLRALGVNSGNGGGNIYDGANLDAVTTESLDDGGSFLNNGIGNNVNHDNNHHGMENMNGTINFNESKNERQNNGPGAIEIASLHSKMNVINPMSLSPLHLCNAPTNAHGNSGNDKNNLISIGNSYNSPLNITNGSVHSGSVHSGSVYSGSVNNSCDGGPGFFGIGNSNPSNNPTSTSNNGHNGSAGVYSSLNSGNLTGSPNSIGGGMGIANVGSRSDSKDSDGGGGGGGNNIAMGNNYNYNGGHQHHSNGYNFNNAQNIASPNHPPYVAGKSPNSFQSVLALSALNNNNNNSNRSYTSNNNNSNNSSNGSDNYNINSGKSNVAAATISNSGVVNHNIPFNIASNNSNSSSPPISNGNGGPSSASMATSMPPTNYPSLFGTAFSSSASSSATSITSSTSVTAPGCHPPSLPSNSTLSYSQYLTGGYSTNSSTSMYSSGFPGSYYYSNNPSATNTNTVSFSGQTSQSQLIYEDLMNELMGGGGGENTSGTISSQKSAVLTADSVIG